MKAMNVRQSIIDKVTSWGIRHYSVVKGALVALQDSLDFYVNDADADTDDEWQKFLGWHKLPEAAQFKEIPCFIKHHGLCRTTSLPNEIAECNKFLVRWKRYLNSVDKSLASCQTLQIIYKDNVILVVTCRVKVKPNVILSFPLRLVNAAAPADAMALAVYKTNQLATPFDCQLCARKVSEDAEEILCRYPYELAKDCIARDNSAKFNFKHCEFNVMSGADGLRLRVMGTLGESGFIGGAVAVKMPDKKKARIDDFEFAKEMQKKFNETYAPIPKGGLFKKPLPATAEGTIAYDTTEALSYRPTRTPQRY
jgi:hypothetical protein